ncbi:hypothetical protein HYPSUDRAFT_55692 [Hypholoma sublateritium FD-334 SS-4]|uniref:Uncharacterized protein n=1 Tax=Hypholoma sublateritium (strain FD-334 SS-4) TaxID=945553 RepID=A0A0D2NX09_HYPSF|nr:hypothetical protein HYPSUDRAFT_55692 [Hypholoma sublateritium FD-334 SS-4]
MARPSPSPSSSSSSSVTPPPTIPISSNKKKGAKDKSKKASASADAGKNEGADLNWAYVPPADTVRVGEEDVDADEFDWETLKNDNDLELCLIRVPESIKPKHLDKLEVTFSTSSQTACIGTLNRKYSSFDIWSIGDGDEQPVGGEEIKSLSCLLPRKGKKGEFYPEPKPIARHLVINAQPIRPTHTSPAVRQNPPRFSYPQEVLKHRYVPYGSVDAAAAELDAMVVDSEPQSPPTVPESLVAEVDPEIKVKKGKKRKGDVDAAEAPPKKSKKSKVA